MTPTEQDKELREKLMKSIEAKIMESGFLDEHDKNVGGKPYTSANNQKLTASALADVLSVDFMQLITADRKRVALEEWEIANEAVLKNAKVISDEEEKLEALALVDPKKHNDKIGSFMDRAFGFDLVFQPFAEARRKRIAELKAQQEEV